MMPRTWMPLMALVVLAACDRAATPSVPSVSAGAEEPLRHYDLGRPATPTEVAARDIDVGPDGEGLPAGSGTVAQGAAIFKGKCMMCHGAKGEGVPPAFPRLIGREAKAEGFVFARDWKLDHTIGNYWPYATTVYDYVRRAMPLLQPGSLTNDEVYSLTAFLLASNQVIPMDATLDAASLKQVKMPYADKFVDDDRRGGHTVK
ncbi:MAG: c-type cytochrome [Gemmatimonadaceae bacterium]